jgi:hypothetical protein
MKKIIIKVRNLEIEAELNNSKTAELIYEKLPIKSKVKLWGEEIYFDIPVKTGLEEGFSKDLVESGDLGYWPEGACFCIFFGPTPISKPGEIRPASRINLIGRILKDPKEFKKVKEGDIIELERR